MSDSSLPPLLLYDVWYDAGRPGDVVSTREGGFVPWIARGLLWLLSFRRFGRPMWEREWIPGTERFYAKLPNGEYVESKDGVEWSAPTTWVSYADGGAP